jgi:two-component sensor histidine kinase
VEPLELDVTLAVPLGLIINEALTNSLKYAFPGDRSGTITLNLKKSDNNSYQLSIADNGIGLPTGIEPTSSRSLGMTLIYGLSKQVGGELSITGSPGVEINLLFHDVQLGSTYSGADYSYRWHRPFTTHTVNQRNEKAYMERIFRKV